METSYEAQKQDINKDTKDTPDFKNCGIQTWHCSSVYKIET